MLSDISPGACIIADYWGVYGHHNTSIGRSAKEAKSCVYMPKYTYTTRYPQVLYDLILILQFLLLYVLFE